MKYLFLYILISFTINLNSQTCQWAIAPKGENGVDYLFGSKSDFNGNIFLTGYFRSDSIQFGNTPPLYNHGNYDIYVAKYNSNGNALWAKSAGGNSPDYAFGVTSDHSGNSYITGSYSSSSIQFGNLQPLNNPNGFLVKLNSFGNALWAKSPISGWGRGNAIVTDSDSNVYIAGYFATSTNFGNNQMLINKGGLDFCIVKYDSSGNVIWVKGAGGTGNDQGNSISIDANHNLVVSGTFTSPDIQFGNTPLLINTGNTSFFIVKYDSSGNVLWAKNSTGSGVSNPSIYTTNDIRGNVFACGAFAGPLQFGNLPTLYGSNWDIFIARYDSSGNALWAKGIGGYGPDQGMNIASDVNGNIFVTEIF